MNWYYVEGGQPAGPVNDAQFEALVRLGKLAPADLVWREGLESWQSLGQARPDLLAAAPAAAPAAGFASPLPEGQARCAECGQVFVTEDMIRHGNLHVCAACKPLFLQKLREGVSLPTGRLNYAGFWIRFAAVFVDGILLFAVNLVISLIAGAGVGLGFSTPQTEPTMAVMVLQLVLMAIQIAIALTYETVMIGKYGATLGKMACGLRVVTPEGAPVSYLRALGRYFAKILSQIICLIGYIMAAFDDEKRALHDRICDTRVILK